MSFCCAFLFLIAAPCLRLPWLVPSPSTATANRCHVKARLLVATASGLSCFLRERQKQKSPPAPCCKQFAIPRPRTSGLPVCHRWLHSQDGSRLSRAQSANHFVSLQPVPFRFKPRALFSCPFDAMDNTQIQVQMKRKHLGQVRVQIHQNIIAKLQAWLSKLTRVRFASLKKTLHPRASGSNFLVCPCILLPPILWWPSALCLSVLFRCKLGGWWLLIYVYRSAGIKCYFLRNIGWFYI
jgi:hypothetical protein